LSDVRVRNVARNSPWAERRLKTPKRMDCPLCQQAIPGAPDQEQLDEEWDDEW
jgi:hypothetical protein